MRVLRKWWWTMNCWVVSRWRWWSWAWLRSCEPSRGRWRRCLDNYKQPSTLRSSRSWQIESYCRFRTRPSTRWWWSWRRTSSCARSAMCSIRKTQSQESIRSSRWSRSTHLEGRRTYRSRWTVRNDNEWFYVFNFLPFFCLSIIKNINLIFFITTSSSKGILFRQH